MTAVEQSFDFEGWGVRVAMIDGEAWFVARDVATVLGYSNISDAVSRHCKGVAKHYPLQTAGGTQDIRVISESDVLRLIVSSKLPAAEQFERFVFETVLPEIRRTGSYNATPVLPDLSTPEGVLALAQTLTKTAEELVAAKNVVAELTPRADAWDELASAEGDYEVADAAKILARAGVETGRQRLFGQLADLGWIFRGPQGKWKARQTAVDAGYLAEKPQSHHHPRTGELVLDPPQVRVTLRGLERLRVRLGSARELAVAYG